MGNDVDVSDEQSQSFENILSNANILLQIDNILLYSDLTEDHKIVYIHDGGAFDNTLTDLERTMAAKTTTIARDDRTDNGHWRNLQHRNHYKYDSWTTDVEDVTISSIERI